MGSVVELQGCVLIGGRAVVGKLSRSVQRAFDSHTHQTVSRLPEIAADLGADLAEVFADAQFEEGIARDLPFLGSVVKAARLSRSISDALLLVKVRVFLRSVDEIPAKERQQFAYDLKRDAELCERVTETVTFALDKADELDKAAIIATLFRALVRKRIDALSFRRLTIAVNQVFAPDLRAAAELRALAGQQP